MRLTEKDVDDCVRVLEALAQDRSELLQVALDKRHRLLTAAGRVSRPERSEQRQLLRAARRKDRNEMRAHDQALLDRTQIRQKRLEPVFVTPDPLELAAAGGGSSGTLLGEEPALREPRACYICKTRITQVHAFYDQMCGACGDFNYAKRTQTADLRGRVALISGARVKIGYQAAILLLRAGARVIVTTRFPRDAALRYAREKDYPSWAERLQICGLDLRHTPSVEAFAQELLAREQRLDFMLHNACQTVRRPAGFYEHLMDGELRPMAELPEAAQRLLPAPTPASTAGLGVLAEASQSHELFPAGKLDADLQQLDLRDENSWRLPLDRVGTVELLEVHLVNAIAPFVLNARLKPLMLRQPSFDKHIVNVSAMEGQFYRRFKTDKHPHTNMAKAALNMMTRTSAVDYARDGIFMNSVDTGWVTDEDPFHIARRKRDECGFHPPLDIVDGAARIVDPIFDGHNTGHHVWGKFLKDYKPAAW
ncbi:MAG TPA: SDR family NAD(P)-dependent oxidoreductase [Polyangiaceae bacterium]|nr:SDR family NAD(P)-dependent oxidoreductase [Polyangiaceae bacterium]